MADEKDVYEIVVTTTGREKLKELEKDVYELGDVYEVLGDEQVDLFESSIQLAMAELKQADAAKQNTAAHLKLADAQEKAGKATKGVGGGFLELSRAVEDAQYGIAGVLNNIPSMISQFGGPAGLAAAISLAAVAAKMLYDHWDDITNLFVDKAAFPEAARDVAHLTKELEAAKKATEDLEKAGKGSAKQLEEYNRLIEHTAYLEKEIAQQQEKQAILKRARESKSEEEEGRAKGAEQALKGRGPEVEKQLRAGYEKEIKDELEANRQGMATRIDTIRASNQSEAEKQAAVQEELARYSKTVQWLRRPENDPAKKAENMVVELLKGSNFAEWELKRLTKATGGMFDDLTTAIASANPVLNKKYDEAEKSLLEMIDGEAEAAKKKQAAIDKETDAWAKEGEDFLAAQAKLGKEKETAREKQRQADIAANKPFLAQEARTIKEGGFAEQAEALMAQAQAAGMGPKQRFAFVEQQAAQQFKEQFPGMPAGQRADMATAVAAMGQKNLNQRMMDLQAREFNAVDATQQAVAETLQNVQQLMARIAQQTAMGVQLQRAARQQHNALQQNQHAAANVGRP